jgi:DNA-directed RNA polymerase subunit RPC12/RpoP
MSELPDYVVPDIIRCRKCGSTIFYHEITSIFDEIFDTNTDVIILDNESNQGDNWRCKHCGTHISSEDKDRFFDVMYEAKLVDRR